MKRCAGPATRLLSDAPELRRFEFPRTSFAGNSSRCIKHSGKRRRDYYRSHPAPSLGSVFASQPKRSTLSSLGLAAVNIGRILMQNDA